MSANRVIRADARSAGWMGLATPQRPRGYLADAAAGERCPLKPGSSIVRGFFRAGLAGGIPRDHLVPAAVRLPEEHPAR